MNGVDADCEALRDLLHCQLLVLSKHRRGNPIAPANPFDHQVVKGLAVSACVSFVVESLRDLRIAEIQRKLSDPRYSDFGAAYSIGEWQR